MREAFNKLDLAALEGAPPAIVVVTTGTGSGNEFEGLPSETYQGARLNIYDTLFVGPGLVGKRTRCSKRLVNPRVARRFAAPSRCCVAYR